MEKSPQGPVGAFRSQTEISPLRPALGQAFGRDDRLWVGLHTGSVDLDFFPESHIFD